MATKYFGTSADNSWTVVQAMTFELDGLEGIDTIHLGLSLRSDYTIVSNADGSISVDSVSSASAALHAKLYNVEVLTFDNGTDVLDLRSYFRDTAAPQLMGSSLADAGIRQAVDAGLVFTFNEKVELGNGTITLLDSGGAIVQTFDATHREGVSFSGNTLTIKPAAPLLNGAAYQLHIGTGALVDLAGNGFAGAAIPFTTVAATVLTGTAHNDTLVASAGDLIIDGGAGTDTLVYALSYGSVTITRSEGVVTVSDGAGADLLTGVERLAFADGTVACDIEGTGGQAYRLYQAAFNREPDPSGLGFWIAMMDQGLSLQAVAAGFVDSDEFKQQVGIAPDHRTLVNHFYQNVLHRSPDEAGYAYWIEVLESGAVTPAQVLTAFSESTENQDALIGTIGNGFVFIPFAG